MHILFTRFPLESAMNGGAELQTVSLMKGLIERGHRVSFAGSCPALLAMCDERGIATIEWHIGPPPVTKKNVVTFAWRRMGMRKHLEELLEVYKLQTTNYKPDAIIMLSLSEKLLLTDIAASQGIKVFWIEHDRVGPWLTKNPWLKVLLRCCMKATTIVVSELSRRIYLSLGWESGRVIAIPNGVDVSRFSPIPRPLPPVGEGGDWPDEYKRKPPVNESTLFHAREMRKEPTKAEKYLWDHLRHDQLGIRFRRQHPIEGKILDFYCDRAKLAIEVDGPTHDDTSQKEWDTERTEKLEAKGIRVIRFTNEQVLAHIDDVITTIKEYLNIPPPSGEGQGVGELRLGCIARLSHEKGIDVLLDAMKQLTDVDLTIVGSGREEPKIRSMIHQINQSTNKPINLLTHFINISDIFDSIDALVLPSRDHDPFGMVAAEAMMLGIPVIVTDACGIADYLESGKDAIVVKAGSAEELAKAIERYKTEDVRRKIGEAGQKTAIEKFSLEAMIERYEKVLKQN